MISHIKLAFIGLVVGNELSFKFVKSVKAAYGDENRIALLENPNLDTVETQANGPIKFKYKHQKNDFLLFQRPRSLKVKKQRQIKIPDYSDHDTVVNFARLTYDAYYDPNDSGWIPVPGWNVVI